MKLKQEQKHMKLKQEKTYEIKEKHMKLKKKTYEIKT